ncbi:hypothetical protein [Burkholderia seminalis]|uniref:hypothetical protein n=1 Tax=Burkholderia seminalis TaxID=488731 RepID=UPI001581B7E2|nr:hypothetical protein [Burkholderia seminalis]
MSITAIKRISYKKKMCSYRCIVPIKSSNIEVCFALDPSQHVQLREILADRERPLTRESKPIDDVASRYGLPPRSLRRILDRST